MRRLVVALIVVGLALSLVGCGGGSSSSGSTSTSGTAAPVPAPAGSPALPSLDNRSANSTDTFEPFPTSDAVPADLKQRVAVDKQPTLIYFYDSTQQASKEVRTMIDAVRAENRGLVDLVAYDLGKYIVQNPDGTFTTDPSIANDASLSAAVKLARDPSINVNYTPFIVLTDGQGYIIYKHSGLVDQAFLEREVLRASR